MDSSPPSKIQEPALPAAAGIKRPAPSLLPPFEPLSSSPGFPRPAKRQARNGSVGSSGAYLKYPTPIPTSSTGILSSSPPRVGGPQHHQHPSGPAASKTRPSLNRAASALAERAPLASVPSIELNDNGETLLMGRSSNSSHYQLSGNRLISRVHAKVRYIPASSPLEPNKVEIICNGWNGLKLHCQGRTWELLKGDSFTSETEGTEIMVDVQDARVMIQWPKKDRRESLANLSDSSWDDSPRPQARGNASGGIGLGLQSSPLRRASRIESPESPTPAVSNHASSQRLASLLPGADSGDIHIFEDASSGGASPVHGEPGDDVGQSFLTEVTNSFSSDLSEPDEDEFENADPDEENDPVVHSFGPFGADLSNRLASITASSPGNGLTSPTKPRPRMSHLSEDAKATIKAQSRSLAAIREALSPQKKKVEVKVEEEEAPQKLSLDHIDVSAVRNHVVNQLAFSRLSSTPLSAIMNNLPAEEKRGLEKQHLRLILEETAAVGTIARQGKDAAGHALESEYYYMPEADDDDQRRLAVTDGLRKPSLRACRKQHKQYYWKRPKTP